VAAALRRTIMRAERPIPVRRPILAAAFCAMCTALVVADYDLSWYTMDGGGDMWSTGGGLELSGTIGQPDAGAVMTGGGFELTGGFWAFGGGAAPQSCIGDLNCDGSISFGDINPFVLYLSNFASWQVTYAGCNPANGDINCDGSYGQGSFSDINPFVSLMTQCGAGCACPGPIGCP
jgi:hypothetical protein